MSRHIATICAPTIQEGTIPKLDTLRRVPRCYQEILPLEVMKRYQCIVIGRARGMLTIGITDQHSTHIFKQLSRLTGCTIFPVLIDPVRMNLLLRRIERSERERQQPGGRRATLHALQIRSMLVFLTIQSQKQSIVQ